MNWTLEDALVWIRQLEGRVPDIHLGLTGSVLFEGESSNDLDIIVYPRTPITSPIDENHVLIEFGLIDMYEGVHKVYEDGKTVYRTTTPTGRRIDVFFLK